MLTLAHRRFGNLLPTFFFVERMEQVPDVPVAWLSRSYLDPQCLARRGYAIITSRWWRTLIIDLTQPLDAIYAGFDKKSTRYCLRCAEKILSENQNWQLEPPGCHTLSDTDLIVDFYTRKQLEKDMTKEKLEGSPTRSYWLSSRAKYRGQVCIVNTNICDPSSGITRTLFGVSAQIPDDIKAEAGHMSRMLCWQDIQWFKQAGYRVYDWGGISKFGELPGIDFFKRSFGGSPAIIYDALICKRRFAALLRSLWVLRFRKKPEVEIYTEDEPTDTQSAEREVTT